MPKPKGKSAPELNSSYHPKEVKDFLSDLDTGAGPAVTPPTAPKKTGHPKRIQVTAEAETPRPEPVKPEIHDILKPADTNQPIENMGKMQRAGKRPWPWGWTIGILALLTASSVGGFFFFNRAQRFAGTKVQVVIDAPLEAASGGDVDLTINYQNLEPVDLVKAELTIEYPEGFTVSQTSRTAENEFKNAFQLGTIKSGRAGSVTIHGIIFGSIGDRRTFGVTMTYRPENFSSDFQSTVEHSMKITSSILELKLEGPKELAPGASGTWTITYTNTSDHDLANVKIEATYPDGLSVTATDPTADERSALWRIASVTKGANGTIEITGTTTGQAGDSIELHVQAGLTGSDNSTEIQAQQSLLIILVTTGVDVAVAVNGETEKSTIHPGDRLEYAIHITNASDAEIHDLTVTTTLTGSAVDLTDLENPAKAKLEDYTLTWTKEQVSSLALLKPQADVTLHFSVATKKTLPVTQDSDVNQQVVAAVTVASTDLPPADTTKPFEYSTKVATVFTFTAEARYYDDAGVALGSGPVPPVVGETTTYRIGWSVTTTTSDAEKLSITATLPTNVFWTGQNVGRDAGDVVFDPGTRVVTWTLNKVPASTGSRLPIVTAHFDLAITPVASQVGSVVVLTQTATAKATDSFTALAIEITQPSTTTDVPTDAKAAGEGKVENP